MSCHEDEDTCQCDIVPVATFPPRRSCSEDSVRSSSCQSRGSAHSDGPQARGSSHRCGGSHHARSSSSLQGGCEECGKKKSSSERRCTQCGKRADQCICRGDRCSNCGKPHHACECTSAQDACPKCGNFHEEKPCKKASSSRLGGCVDKSGSGPDRCGKSKCPDCGETLHRAESECGGKSASNRRCEMSRSRQRDDCGSKRSASRCDKSQPSPCFNRSGGKSSHHRSRADKSKPKCCPEEDKCDVCAKMGKRSGTSGVKKQASKCGSQVFRYDGRKNTRARKTKRKKNRDLSCGQAEKHRDKSAAHERDDCPEEKDGCQKEEEDAESFGCDDLCSRCQQELSGGGAGGGGNLCPSTPSSEHCMQNARSTRSLKPDIARAARPVSAASGGRSPSCVSARPRSASCDSAGARSSSSCDACGGQKTADSGLQPESAGNSDYILDENCPIHGTKAAACPQDKQDNCGQPACQNKAQVRFSGETLNHSPAPSSRPTTPHGGARCPGAKSRVNELTSAQCPVGHAACAHSTPGPQSKTRCPHNSLACSTRNFTDSKLKFDLLFSNICETLSNEMYRIQMDPCITCCVPKYVTRGKSRSRRNVTDATDVVEATSGCDGAARKRKPTSCDDSPCCPSKDGCGKTG